MELTVLGAGPAWSDRPAACGAAYLVRHGSTSLLLDLGHGAFSRLAAAVEPSTIDAVAISHLHPDHFVDLIPLRHYLQFQLDRPRRVRVLAPVGLADRLDALHDSPGFTAATLDCERLGETERQIGELTLESRLVAHTAESYAVRVAPADDRSAPGLVYSGDCGEAQDLEPLIRPGDALLVEVSFGPGPVPAGVPHLDAPTIAALAARTRPGRILLTHLQMGFDEAETVRVVADGTGRPATLVGPGFVTEV